MTDTKKEVINELYNAALVRAGVAGLSRVTRKAFGESLGAPVTLKGASHETDCRNCRQRCGVYKEEVKRHNQTLEKLAKAKEKFYESEVKRRNDEARRRAEILDANKDNEETNRALEDLRNFTRLMNDSVSRRKPKLEDYYQPSEEMKTHICHDDDGCFGS
ncbi:Hypothetical predicted protein [Paramuricea clavata]|uniref:Uncharacterized protein n=1 Tax=Paramuricea clavata TaxID=317549 RepID=A0A6S7I3K8_PARCT|nr:Hypothetical predicted protein [Paramuricea clavata]